jgi:Glycine-zipper domain
MIISRMAASALLLLALAGCVTAPIGPSVAAMPGEGKSFEAFQGDDANCRQYAAQQTGIAPTDAANQSFFGSAAIGTLLGAASGAAIGAAFANPAAGAAIGAASGFGLGAMSGAGAAQYSGGATQQHYDVAYAQCMQGHGDHVQQAAAAQPYGYAGGYPYYGYSYPYSYPYAYGPSWYWPPFFVNFGFGGYYGGYRYGYRGYGYPGYGYRGYGGYHR